MKNMKKAIYALMFAVMTVFVLNPVTASAASPKMTEKYVLKMVDNVNKYNKVSYTLASTSVNEDGEMFMVVLNIKYNHKKRNLVADVSGYVVYELPDNDADGEGEKELVYSYTFKKNMNTGKYSYKPTDDIGEADYADLAKNLDNQFKQEDFLTMGTLWMNHMLGGAVDSLADMPAQDYTEYPKFWSWWTAVDVNDYDVESGYVVTEASMYVSKKGTLPDDSYIKYVNVATDEVLMLDTYNIKFSK